MDRSELIDRFKRLGIRVTAQRLAVAEVLANSHDHPSAQQVYERVREHFPHITLGTIYNTVSMLEEKGLVQALVFANGTRYDTNVLSHANLVCVECGRIIDANDEDGAVSQLRAKVAASSGFEIIGQRVDFYGTCSECAAFRSRAATPWRRSHQGANHTQASPSARTR